MRRHAILLDPSGTVRGTSKPLQAVSIIIDTNDPSCDEALDTAATAGVRVLACAVTAPAPAIRERLHTLNFPLFVNVDAGTLCRELSTAIERARGGDRAEP